MDEKKIIQDELGVFSNHTYNLKIKEFDIFNQLCDKAKELTFVYSHKEGSQLGVLDVMSFDEELVKMTPIEQILYIAFCIYEFYCEEDFQASLYPQFICECGDTKYIVDFLIESVCIDKCEIVFKKPIVIECDGFEYHSNKKQMENDYARENALKSNGYDIMRFTGSQIYNNPFGCVKEIIKYIYKTLEDLNGSN